MSKDLKDFCYQTSILMMNGLAQNLDIQPGTHYFPAIHNSSRVLSLRLRRINPHYLPRIRGLRDQLTMWTGLSDEFKVRIGWDNHSITIEVPKPKRYWAQITLDQLEARHYIRRGVVATLGLGLQDDPQRIDFTEPATAHTFIAGQTRSGKTNTQQLIAWNLARNASPDEARLLIFDVAKRGYKWRSFDRLAHLSHPVITTVEDADRALAWCLMEIEQRSQHGYTSPRQFVFIDELKALIDDSQVADGYLNRLASIGGEFGLHLILATQYPQIKMLGSAELKRNVTTRLCGRVDDANAAANALGLPESGAEHLQGYGDFLLKSLDGMARLTVAHLQEIDIERLPRSDTHYLPLPNDDQVYAGARSTREPDPLEPEQVGLALFEPMGINKLANTLGIGSTKAARIKSFADRIRAWAIEHGYPIPEAVG